VEDGLGAITTSADEERLLLELDEVLKEAAALEEVADRVITDGEEPGTPIEVLTLTDDVIGPP